MSIAYFAYDTLCQMIWGRTLGQKNENIRLVQTKEIPFQGVLRRGFRSVIYNNYLFFMANAIVLLFIPSYKTIEDHLFKYDVISDEEMKEV